jgi:hypothetical protein
LKSDDFDPVFHKLLVDKGMNLKNTFLFDEDVINNTSISAPLFPEIIMGIHSSYWGVKKKALSILTYFKR